MKVNANKNNDPKEGRSLTLESKEVHRYIAEFFKHPQNLFNNILYNVNYNI